ncbi:MAG: nicotinate-nicotinamide nucleotide adenylyltransferase [Bdellovibrionales bacterium]|nr:nicotinate-nicotinamide nucleotide adenylyltransferase [Bdellovibrionales bacterium]
MPSPTTPSWPECTLIFGGTFDPPHLGHREAALGLLRQLHPAKLLLLPAGQPPLKRSGTSAADRLAMVRLAFDYTPAERGGTEVVIDEREIGLPEPSYTATTLESLKDEEPHPVFVMGTDQLLQMERWNRFPEILGLSHWLIVLRKPWTRTDAEERLFEWAGRKWVERPDPSAAPGPAGAAWRIPARKGLPQRYLWLLETQAPEMASSRLRQAPGPELEEVALKPEVAQFIREKGLYAARSQVD